MEPKGDPPVVHDDDVGDPVVLDLKHVDDVRLVLARLEALEVLAERQARTIRRLQRSREYARRTAVNGYEKAEERQREIGRLERKLLGIYKVAREEIRDALLDVIVAGEPKAAPAPPEARRAAIIVQIVEAAIPNKVGEWRARRNLPPVG